MTVEEEMNNRGGRKVGKVEVSRGRMNLFNDDEVLTHQSEEALTVARDTKQQPENSC